MAWSEHAMKHWLIVFIFSGFGSVPRYAQSSDHFHLALASAKQGDWVKARDEFKLSLVTNPREPVVYYNLGVTEYQSGRLGYAIAYWRQALVQKPGFKPAHQALREVEARHILNLGDSSELKELIQWLVTHLSLDTFLLPLALSLLFLGLKGLSYLNERQFAERVGENLPALPNAILGWAAASALLLSIIFVYIYDSRQGRGTIVEKAVELKLTPLPEDAVLARIPEGISVEVLAKANSWVQVQVSPSLSGWVRENELVQTRGATW